jgi:hypothetical protein
LRHAIPHFRPHLALVGGRQTADQLDDFYAVPPEKFSQNTIVLLGEDFRRRHEGNLVAILDGDEHCRRRHDRFARTDFAMQQSVHRMGLLHVGKDFADDLALVICQLKRQRAG